MMNTKMDGVIRGVMMKTIKSIIRPQADHQTMEINYGFGNKNLSILPFTVGFIIKIVVFVKNEIQK